MDAPEARPAIRETGPEMCVVELQAVVQCATQVRMKPRGLRRNRSPWMVRRQVSAAIELHRLACVETTQSRDGTLGSKRRSDPILAGLSLCVSVLRELPAEHNTGELECSINW